MKKTIKILIAIGLFIPSITHGAFAVGWNATSTTSTGITPNAFNGVNMRLVITSTGTSTFAGDIVSTCFATSTGGACITGGGSGSGTVSSGLTGQTAYYAANGTTVTGTSTVSLADEKATITALNLSGLTASRILGLDGSKNVVALDTATYPSLTELSYVKGVTSAIQTQIDGKQASDATLTALAAYNTNGIMTQTAADTFTGRTITGTASRISISNGNGVSGNPTIDIDSGYVGQASITTLGTIANFVATNATSTTLAVTGTTINLNGNPIYATTSKAMSLASTTLDAYGKSLNTGTTTLPLFNNDAPMTVTGFYCQASTTGQARIRFGDGTNWSQDAFCSTTGAFNAMSSNNTFTAFEPFVVQASSTASTTQRIHFTVFYKNTP